MQSRNVASRAVPGLMPKIAEAIQQHAAAQAVGPTPEDPSAQELEFMLEELVEAYKEPGFQAELTALHAQCAKLGTNLLMAMGPVVLKVQAPILKRYGQPPNFQGVDSMKHAVQRRVAEGAHRLERLANEARVLLGLEPMPNRNATCEQVLAARLDETSRYCGQAGTEQLERLCRERIVAEREAGTLPAASAAHLEKLLDSGSVLVTSILSLLKMARNGVHVSGLQGLDLPSEVPVLEAPSPEEFFQMNVLNNRPAVLRKALDAARFPPLRDFPDHDFLRRLCGHRRVLVKSLAHEDRWGRPVFVTDPELKLPLAAFLEGLREHQRSGTRVPFYLGKVPLRKELPELAQEITGAPACPQRLYGSCFGALVPEGVFTYFGCGRNTTAVHFDGHENLLLCLCGGKRLLLYPPSDARYLYPCNDFTRSPVVPFAHLEELSDDLQRKFSLVARARPLEVQLSAGDMLYLPSCWWHCVEGSEEPNMILNWWFGLHSEKKALAFNAA